MPDTAIFDVDGTLVDTNYQHSLAWFRAFQRLGITLPLWQIHRGIGMGGDKLVAHLAGTGIEEQLGDELRAAWSEEFDRMIDEVQPFAAARPLLAEVRERGFKVVLASSGSAEHVEVYLDLLGARDLAEAWTTADDVARTKPSPDLVRAALAKVDGAQGCLVGDSPWDCRAAAALDLPTVGVLTGGFAEPELSDAGAVRVFASLGAMLDELDTTPLRRPDA